MDDHNEPLTVGIDDVRKSYYVGRMEVPILHGINLSVKRGEFLAGMCQSGSGKSTLLNLIGCPDRPTGGDIHISGKDVSKLSEAELAHLMRYEIGFVLQTFNLVSMMGVFKNAVLT